MSENCWDTQTQQKECVCCGDRVNFLGVTFPCGCSFCELCTDEGVYKDHPTGCKGPGTNVVPMWTQEETP